MNNKKKVALALVASIAISNTGFTTFKNGNITLDNKPLNVYAANTPTHTIIEYKGVKWEKRSYVDGLEIYSKVGNKNDKLVVYTAKLSTHSMLEYYDNTILDTIFYKGTNVKTEVNIPDNSKEVVQKAPDTSIKPAENNEGTGKYENTDYKNKNGYVFPKDSIFTGKYLNTSVDELDAKIKGYMSKGALSKSELNDFIDVGFSLCAANIKFIPESVTFDGSIKDGARKNGNNIRLSKKTPNKTLVADTSLNAKTDVLDTILHEMMRFYDGNYSVQYPNIKNFKQLAIGAEKERTNIDKDYSTTYKNLQYMRYNLAILRASATFRKYYKRGGNLNADDLKILDSYVNTFKIIDYKVLPVRKDEKGNFITFDSSVPKTLAVTEKYVKSNTVTKENYSKEIAIAAKKAQTINDVTYALNDYTKYQYAIYKNSKVVAAVDYKLSGLIKNHNEFNHKTMYKFFMAPELQGVMNPIMVNEQENTNIFNNPQMAMYYLGVDKITEKPYSSDEYAKIKDKVMKIYVDSAVELGLKGTESGTIITEHLFKLVDKNLRKQGIEFSRIPTAISSDSLKLAIKNKKN